MDYLKSKLEREKREREEIDLFKNIVTNPMIQQSSESIEYLSVEQSELNNCRQHQGASNYGRFYGALITCLATWR